MKLEEAKELWKAGNNAGKGFGVGLEHDSPVVAASREGLGVVKIDDDGFVVAKKDDGALVGIGFAHGPWAVDL